MAMSALPLARAEKATAPPPVMLSMVASSPFLA
jgi:hypothetical protein